MAMFNALLRFTTCIIGVILSLYALHVEIAKEKDADFKAMCDISEKMSCSKVFNSKQKERPILAKLANLQSATLTT
eukprot:gene15457-6707_t